MNRLFILKGSASETRSENVFVYVWRRFGLPELSASGFELSTTSCNCVIDGAIAAVFQLRRMFRLPPIVPESVIEGSTSVNVAANEVSRGNDRSLSRRDRCAETCVSQRQVPNVCSTASPPFCTMLRLTKSFDWSGSTIV
jgi:hypothetical protein